MWATTSSPARPARPAPRYLTDVAGSGEGSLFSAELDQSVLPNLDAAAGNMMMVSTFNEWHEDTQIEPSNIAPATSIDISGSNTYSQGYAYTGYGNLYLDLLHQKTSVPDPGSAGVLGIAALVLRRRRRRE